MTVMQEVYCLCVPASRGQINELIALAHSITSDPPSREAMALAGA